MKYVRSGMIGFLTVAMLHLLVTCSEDDSGTQPTPNSVIDVTAIHAGAAQVEEAFRSADPDAVLAVLTEEAQAQYGDELEGIVDQMPAFADAIASRQLVSYTEYYAEYTFNVEGETLTFAMAAQDENDWKLMRF